MDRRDVLKAGFAVTAAAALPCQVSAAGGFAPIPGRWRRFEIVTRLTLAGGKSAQAWVPLPSLAQTGWARPLGNSWTTNASTANVESDPKYGIDMLHLTWSPGVAAAAVAVTTCVETCDRAVDLTRPDKTIKLPAADHALYTSATALIPTDGLVRRTAQKITAGSDTDVAKARAIYAWVVDNTFRKAAVRGCGLGDVASMLAMGDLGGKCADINALFVGLARSVGLPARDLYGIRVAPSRFGYKSLGPATATITKAQHCRAEVFLSDYGWVPVDPADVRKVALEEPPGNLALSDAKVATARATLFGSSEGNWVAYNSGHDVHLHGSHRKPIPFLMYPEGEIEKVVLDCLDPATFSYGISAKELSV